MIHRKHRFHRRSSFRYVYQRGRAVRNPLYCFRYVENPRSDEYRVAVVVSRKVSKSAVVRNRIRRRLYEIIRTQDGVINKPYDLVFTVYSDQLAEMDITQLRQLIMGELKSSSILSNKNRGEEGLHAIVKAKEQQG